MLSTMMMINYCRNEWIVPRLCNNGARPHINIKANGVRSTFHKPLPVKCFFKHLKRLMNTSVCDCEMNS